MERVDGRLLQWRRLLFTGGFIFGLFLLLLDSQICFIIF